ncbi:patatin-like phospholipase family protein [Pontixanthobacter aquaemixtae]|uniref:PNPLA domain-containing protein n=1 Tax=Pontixanthobacter aquaemixtae TaxID=1958940 RepID=A0A844ZRM1_9SPHN|nr:patatin-like phospholipase family protein [Pontixanthobacter aquaemixtae]MXO90493.1 hypothetical protein [Pontixanthobacter aquaemixtae]
MAYKIIAFDGGGMRGLVSALLLNELDPKGDLVKSTDLFAGTASGASLALALADDVPLETIIDLYRHDGEAIFEEAAAGPDISDTLNAEDRKLHDAVTVRAEAAAASGSNESVFRAKYKPENLRSTLGAIFGAAKLCEVPRSSAQVVVNALQLWSADEKQWTPVSIGSGRQDPFAEMLMVDAAMCSGATPTYFPPHAPALPQNNQWGHFAGGGMFANNPSASAISYAAEHFRADVADIRLLSIGTGKAPCGIRPKEVGNPGRWGVLEWLRPMSRKNSVPATPLIEAALSASATSCEQHAKRMLGDRYIRANLELEHDYALDNWQDVAVLEEAVADFVQTDAWDVIVDAVYDYWNNPDPLAAPIEVNSPTNTKSWLASLFA